MSRAAKLIFILSLGINALAFAAFIVMEQTVQISERVFARLNLERPILWVHRYDSLDYHPLATQAISVHGIAGFKHDSTIFNRLGHSDFKLRAELVKLGKHAAGGRVRFVTDSPRLHLPFQRLMPYSFSYPYLSEHASSGIDIYIDNNYLLTLTKNDSKEAFNISSPSDSKKMRLVEIYLPSFSSAELQVIGVEHGSRLAAAPDLKPSLVFYGTSITQGASAPRPGLTYPAIISRELGAEFYNFGFAGNGRGDPEIAHLLANIDADVYILEYSRQATSIEGDISGNLFEFCTILKTRRPEAAIVIMTALYDTAEVRGYDELEMRRRAFRVAFERLKMQSSDIHLVEGDSLLGPDDRDHFSDGTHPNALGMSTVADRLLPILRSILMENHGPAYPA